MGDSESGVLQWESAYSFMEPSPGMEVAAAEPEKGVLIAAWVGGMVWGLG
jgi:hypothetical protein